MNKNNYISTITKYHQIGTPVDFKSSFPEAVVLTFRHFGIFWRERVKNGYCF
jgi:hypothetical protein